MPLEAQTRLLRVLQSGEFTTVGGARTIQADVRIVAATNRDLAAQVAAGLFREDLFYRLNVVPVALPPLRERGSDIAILAHHFLDRAVAQGLPRRRLAAEALVALERHIWPGNVRELENVMRRLAVLARDEVIDGEAIRAMLGAPPTVAAGNDADMGSAVRGLIDRIARERPQALDDGTLYDHVIGTVERPLIEAMLARHGHNQLRAARALGINRNTLRKRLDTLGIKSRDEEPSPG
jgi:two-component system nitrogen regulation response regulator GlnG